MVRVTLKANGPSLQSLLLWRDKGEKATQQTSSCSTGEERTIHQGVKWQKKDLLPDCPPKKPLMRSSLLPLCCPDWWDLAVQTRLVFSSSSSSSQIHSVGAPGIEKIWWSVGGRDIFEKG